MKHHRVSQEPYVIDVPGGRRVLLKALVLLAFLLLGAEAPRAQANGNGHPCPEVVIAWSAHGLVGPSLKEEEISVIGTWSREAGWRRIRDDGFGLLRTVTPVWTLYGKGMIVPRVRSTSLRVVDDEHGTRLAARLSADAAHPLSPGVWIGVAGPVPADHRSSDFVSPAEDSAIPAIKEDLLRQGLMTRPGAFIEYAVRVDLNNDGIDDRVLQVYNGMPVSGEYPEGSPFDIVVVALGGDGSGFRCVPLTMQSWKRVQRFGFFLKTDVVAVADLNGDGAAEVVVRLLSNDYSGVEIYELQDAAFRLVLHHDHACEGGKAGGADAPSS